MAKRRQSPRPASRRPTVNQAAPDAFARLLGEKQRRADGRNGALQVAMAVASSAPRVRVDATVAPFTPTPSDLFNRTFDDARVGLDRAGMASFKGNLRALLPGIAADVDAIPEDPSLPIRDVARYVAASLGAAGRERHLPRARPRAGG